MPKADYEALMARLESPDMVEPKDTKERFGLGRDFLKRMEEEGRIKLGVIPGTTKKAYRIADIQKLYKFQ